jgi:formate C-acetyltransferase
MSGQRRGFVNIPGLDGPLQLDLSPALEELREKALATKGMGPAYWNATSVEMHDAMAGAWSGRDPREDWQTWRARRFAARATSMPIELERGEPIVGKPRLRVPTAEEATRIDQIVARMGPVATPGGDDGHFHPNYERVLGLGVGGMLERIDALARAHRGDPGKAVFYAACRTTMEAFQSYIRRVADECRRMAAATPAEAGHWNRVASVCSQCASEAPATFHEACQLMYFVFITSWVADDHGMTCYGRMDRTLNRFYEADIAAGRLTPKAALELISAMYIQVNRICPVNLADGVIVGGQDGEGRDVTNTVSYLCLAARRATWLSYPALGIAWHEGTPGALFRFGIDMLAAGINDPAFFGDDLIAGGLQDHGVSVEDSHNWMNSTCVEIKTAGTSNVWVATEYVNCPGHLMEAMRREAAGEWAPAAGLQELQDRIRRLITENVGSTATALDAEWRKRMEIGCFPFASCLIDDCLERGLDHDRDGCRYHWAENSYVGLANLVDSLVAIDELVYSGGEMTLAELYAVCQTDFQAHEPLRRRIISRFPKYGNSDARPDALAGAWATFLSDMTETFSVGGHRYVPGFFCHMNHLWLGEKTCATPDGRFAGKPFADGAGAVQGMDRSGPTASVLSTTTWSHRKSLGGLVQNVRFSGSMFQDPSDREAVRNLIETYLRRGGFEIQVNVVSPEVLRDARKNPEAYRDLVVRVAGYSDYFTSLPGALQEEVIARTEFQGRA